MAHDRSRERDLTHRLLGGIDPEVRKAIVATASRRAVRPAQVLYRMGEPADCLFVIIKGRVQLSRPSRTGREMMIGILEPGDVLGLVCLLARHSGYMGTAEVMEAGEVLAWDRSIVQRLARRYPQLSANGLTVAMGLVIQFVDRHEALVEATATERLARALSRLGMQSGTRSAHGIDVRIKNDQLAALADVSAFTASRVLKQWERDGAVKKSRGTVRIVDPDGLLPA